MSIPDLTLAQRDDLGGERVDASGRPLVVYGGLDEELPDSGVSGAISRTGLISAHTEWDKIDLSGTDISDTDFNGLHYEDGMRLVGALAAERCNFSECNIPNSNFDGLALVDSDFSQSDISKSTANGVDAHGCNFDGVTANYFEFSGNFNNTSWESADLINARATEPVTVDDAIFQYADLRGADLSGITSAKEALWIGCLVDANTKLPEKFISQDIEDLKTEIEEMKKLQTRVEVKSSDSGKIDDTVSSDRRNRLEELRNKKNNN